MVELTIHNLNEGTGPLIPPKATVKILYTGKLSDGTVFDDQIEREFDLTLKDVIPGLFKGIQQMRKGQKATLICPPIYAYGTQGHRNIIPPNATLTFEIEILDVKGGQNDEHQENTNG